MENVYLYEVSSTEDFALIEDYEEREEAKEQLEFYLKEKQIRTVDLEFARKDTVTDGAISILVTLRLQKRTSHEALLTELGTFPGVTLMEEV